VQQLMAKIDGVVQPACRRRRHPADHRDRG
jgi:hypothetical protein